MSQEHSKLMGELGIERVPLSQPPMRGVYNALTPERSAQLCEAISTYPNFKTACAACFVSDKTVVSWLRRGTLPDAAPLMAEFAATFLKADSDHARTCYEMFKTLAAQGNGTANAILKYMTSRWKLGDQEDLVAATEQGKKKTDNLEALLRDPTPRLQHLLRLTGWVRHAAWGTENWGKVINTTGETAPEQG
jgi:hypothetical protein